MAADADGGHEGMGASVIAGVDAAPVLEFARHYAANTPSHPSQQPYVASYRVLTIMQQPIASNALPTLPTRTKSRARQHGPWDATRTWSSGTGAEGSHTEATMKVLQTMRL